MKEKEIELMKIHNRELQKEVQDLKYVIFTIIFIAVVVVVLYLGA